MIFVAIRPHISARASPCATTVQLISNMRITGQIQYLRPDNEDVHSDICFPTTNVDRKFLHDTLDEFLDKVVLNDRNAILYDDGDGEGETPYGLFELYLSDHDHEVWTVDL